MREPDWLIRLGAAQKASVSPRSKRAPKSEEDTFVPTGPGRPYFEYRK